MTSISNEIKTMNVVVQVLLGFLVHFLSAGVDLPDPIQRGEGGGGGGGGGKKKKKKKKNKKKNTSFGGGIIN